MKRSILFLSCLMIFYSSNVATAKDDQQNCIITNYNGEKFFSLYGAYFIAKEICASFFHLPFMNYQKINLASIYCTKEHHKNNVEWLWASLIFTFQQDLIDQLKYHIYHDSCEQLSAYILEKYSELELPCPQCGQYTGYYLPEQIIKSMNN